MYIFSHIFPSESPNPEFSPCFAKPKSPGSPKIIKICSQSGSFLPFWWHPAPIFTHSFFNPGIRTGSRCSQWYQGMATGPARFWLIHGVEPDSWDDLNHTQVVDIWGLFIYCESIRVSNFTIPEYWMKGNLPETGNHLVPQKMGLYGPP